MSMSRRNQLARVIDRNGGHGYGGLIVDEARRADIPISLGAALVEQESAFRNVFGRDAVRNPVKSRRLALRVTRLRYAAYKAFRKRGLGMQGVGLTQLTWYGLQDEADRLGGAWKPTYQLRVGFRHVASLIEAYGPDDGIRRYNGAGPDAVRYSMEVQRKARRWHKRFEEAGLA